KQWQRGTPQVIETYLSQYPELGTRDTLSPGLILAEYEARQQTGAPCSWAEFDRRFPRVAAEARQRAAKGAAAKPAPPPAARPSVSDRAAPGSSAPPERFGRYRILKKLGQGGMGAVYLAHDTQLDRNVALKIPQFNPETEAESLARFYREARSAATLQHPNICPVYDVGEIGGVHYLTMAFIEGQTLAEVLEKGRLSPEHAAGLTATVALALDEA